MFNPINRIHRLFSWIKTQQEHQNSLIVQEQLGNVVHQVVVDSVVDSPELASNSLNNNESSAQANSDESNITTSFNLTTSDTSAQADGLTSNNSNQVRDSSPMQYQPPSSLSLLGNSTSNTSNVNNRTSSQPSGARHNRRHRRHRHGNRTSRSNHRSTNSSSSSRHNASSAPAQNASFQMNLFSSKRAERNILSASCAVFCIAILAVSLVEIRWFHLDGGGCNVNYIGVAHFFAPGRLEYQLEMSKVDRSKELTVYKFILPNGLVLKNCANREIMLIMRAVIAFVFLAIFSSCIGLMLDTFGCMKSGVKLIRRHGLFHILTVVFCLIINGFCFWISEKMYEQQNDTRGKKGKKIEISFDVSYYLIVLASGLSILATAFTLIRRYPTDEDEQLERLLEEYTGFEEPVHLERSLPARAYPSACQQFNNLSNQSIINNILNGTTNGQMAGNYILPRLSSRLQQHQQGPPPPPPETPPPPLHVNISNPNNRSSNSEPPPPYDPAPVIA